MMLQQFFFQLIMISISFGEILQEPMNLTVQEGQSAHFPCYSDTDEVPDWYINGALYVASRLPPRHAFLYSERAMIVRNVSITDNGTRYRCSFDYGLVNSNTAILTVISRFKGGDLGNATQSILLPQLTPVSSMDAYSVMPSDHERQLQVTDNNIMIIKATNSSEATWSLTSSYTTNGLQAPKRLMLTTIILFSGLALVCLVLTVVFSLVLSFIIIRKKRATFHPGKRAIFHPAAGDTTNVITVEPFEPVYADILDQEVDRDEPKTELNICYGDGKPNTCNNSTEPVYTEIDRLSVVLNDAYNISL